MRSLLKLRSIFYWGLIVETRRRFLLSLIAASVIIYKKHSCRNFGNFLIREKVGYAIKAPSWGEVPPQ